MSRPHVTLHGIVRALGGDLYQGGLRANVPAPGHSADDRSISLLLSDGRVVVHSFGGTDWRRARDHLRDLGLLDSLGRPLGCAAASTTSAPVQAAVPERRWTARRLWDEAQPLRADSLSAVYLRSRRVLYDPGELTELRHHPSAPLVVYRAGRVVRPALIAAIREPGGILTAVEITYLGPNGRRAVDLRLSRKIVGVVPTGSAIRLSPPGADHLIGEGMVTTLCAMTRFSLPGWALMSVRNLAGWSPPPEVRRVLIAGDRGVPGETAALTLRRRLVELGVEAEVVLPDPPFGDWNEAASDPP